MHTVVGAGATSGGSMDASNLLKPALARGQLRCIGATTIDEYRKYIEKDKVNTSNMCSKRLMTPCVFRLFSPRLPRLLKVRFSSIMISHRQGP